MCIFLCRLQGESADCDNAVAKSPRTAISPILGISLAFHLKAAFDGNNDTTTSAKANLPC